MSNANSNAPTDDITTRADAILPKMDSLLRLMKETGRIEQGLRVNQLIYDLRTIMKSRYNTGNAAQSLIEQAEEMLASEGMAKVCDEARGKIRELIEALVVVTGEEQEF